MKTNLNGFAVFCMGVVLLAGTAHEAAAQDPSADVTIPLTMALTVTYQANDVVSGTDQSITTHATKSVKWNTTSLIKLIVISTSNSYVSSDKLELAGGAATVADSKGDSIDASSILTFTFDPAPADGSAVETGKDNSDSGAFNDTSTTYGTIAFDDGNGNTFTLTGLARIVSSCTATTDKNGDPTAAYTEGYSISFTGAGNGT